MNIFLKNDAGKPSVSLTMTVISFTAVTMWLVGWVVGSALGFAIPPFDAMSAMGYLTPLLTLYFGRRFTATMDYKNQKSDIAIDGQPVPTPGSDSK